MKKFIVIFVFLLSFITNAKELTINIMNTSNGQLMVFEPSYLKASVGDKITFIPSDPGHNSTSVFTPNGAKSWKGEDGEKVSVTLDKEGLYIYECTNHSVMAMVGFIEVGKPVNTEEAKTFFQEFKKKFVMNKDRFDKLFK